MLAFAYNCKYLAKISFFEKKVWTFEKITYLCSPI